MTQYSGGCHCGKVAYTVSGEISGVIECNCSICSKRGYVLWFVPASDVQLSTPESALSTYRFKSGKIAHQFCAACASATFARAQGPDGTPMVAINLRCLDGVDLRSIDIQAVDGRSL